MFFSLCVLVSPVMCEKTLLCELYIDPLKGRSAFHKVTTLPTISSHQQLSTLLEDTSVRQMLVVIGLELWPSG